MFHIVSIHFVNVEENRLDGYFVILCKKARIDGRQTFILKEDNGSKPIRLSPILKNSILDSK